MIPLLLLVGLLLGRWWRVVIPVATIGWAVLLIATGVDSGLAFFAEAALFGFINVTVGVLVFQAVRLVFQAVSPRATRSAVRGGAYTPTRSPARGRRGSPGTRRGLAVALGQHHPGSAVVRRTTPRAG